MSIVEESSLRDPQQSFKSLFNLYLQRETHSATMFDRQGGRIPWPAEACFAHIWALLLFVYTPVWRQDSLRRQS
jgi:hypothetical protein